jgi:AcrR family transcriptional regulator
MPRLRVAAAGTPNKGSAAAAVKCAALRLFSERGVDGVTVREIAELAGQKNHGAVAYYFGTKEALVRGIVEDGAKIIDERRNALLDELETGGRKPAIGEVIDAIIYPSLDVGAAGDDDCYLRFTQILHLTHQDLFESSVGNRWNSGYQRCLKLLRELMPPMPPELASQRLVFIGTYIAQILAARQTALADKSRKHTIWPSERTLRHLSLTATALAMAPVEEA